jgi:hypothetical protein
MAEADPRRTTYEVGEYVLIEYQPSALVKGRAPNKLLHKLRTSFWVLSSVGDRYRLASLSNGIMRKYTLQGYTLITSILVKHQETQKCETC